MARSDGKGKLARVAPRDLYRHLLQDIRARVRVAQHRAVAIANAELIRLYWDVGRLIEERQHREGWGAGVVPRLARDLRKELPGHQGFSESNLKRMLQFAREYPALFAIGARPVPQLPDASTSLDTSILCALSWGHNIILMQKVKLLKDRIWYAERSLELAWSRDALAAQIRSRAHARRGRATTNFARTLPAARAEAAQDLLKDPYVFDFLQMDSDMRERDLEQGLLAHVQRFLLELGRGFAFVGRQHRLAAGEREFYIDLLFYHLQLRCFVVVDLKFGQFEPEHAGKIGFYAAVVDDQLRHASDQPTIGLILCQNKDRVVAEYALRGMPQPIGVAEYELTRSLPKKLRAGLPTIEALEAELDRVAPQRRPVKGAIRVALPA